MKRIALILLVTILYGAIVGLLLPSPAGAFEPPNQRLYPYPEYPSYVVNEIKATNRATWRSVDTYGWSGWRSVVAEGLNTGAGYRNSLGNILSAAVPAFSIREAQASETPTILQIAESAAAQQTHCNDPEGWSVACAYLLSPTPAPTYYKASTMQLYGFVDQASVVEHETFHHVARACDQYSGGCPKADGSGWLPVFQCLGNPDTLMDCGLGARFAQPFDVDTFLLATGFQRFVKQERYIAPDGWQYDPNTGIWYDPRGVARFGPCNQDRLRLDLLDLHWWRPAGGYLGFDYDLGRHVIVPAC